MGLFSCIKDHQGVSVLGQCFVCWVGLWVFRDKSLFSHWIELDRWCADISTGGLTMSIHKAGKHGGCCFLVLRVYELIQLHEHRESPEELRDHVFSALFRHEAFRVWVRVGCGAWVREHIIACQAKLGLCETWRGVSVFPPLFFYEAPRINLD